MKNQNENVLWTDIDVAQFDMITVERRARELRAQAFAEMFGRLARWTMHKLHIARPAMGDQAV